jgi:hypothetical protein
VLLIHEYGVYRSVDDNSLGFELISDGKDRRVGACRVAAADMSAKGEEVSSAVEGCRLVQKLPGFELNIFVLALAAAVLERALVHDVNLQCGHECATFNYIFVDFHGQLAREESTSALLAWPMEGDRRALNIAANTHRLAALRWVVPGTRPPEQAKRVTVPI